MNLIILSKIPSFVLALIIIEVILMVGLGGFLIFDIVKGKLKERKKKREEEEAFKREAREKSISLDSQEDTYLDTGMSELEYLRKMTLEQREYIDALEKRIRLTEEIENQNVHQNIEYVEEEEAINEDEGFNEFWDSIPVKEDVVIESEEETLEESLEEITEESVEEAFEETMDEIAEESEEETLEESLKETAEESEEETFEESLEETAEESEEETFEESLEETAEESEEETFEESMEETAEESEEEAFEESLEETAEESEEETFEEVLEEMTEESEEEILEEAFDEAEDLNENQVQMERDSNETLVFTASSLKAVVEDPLEQKRKQEKIQAFLKSYKEDEEAIEDIPNEDIEYDLVEPWYCQAKPFVKKKKKYNNY